MTGLAVAAAYWAVIAPTVAWNAWRDRRPHTPPRKED